MRGLSCVSTGCTGALRRNESCELLSWMETIVDRWKCACGELIYYRAGGSRDLKWVPVKMNTRDYNSVQGRHGLIVVFKCIIGVLQLLGFRSDRYGVAKWRGGFRFYVFYNYSSSSLTGTGWPGGGGGFRSSSLAKRFWMFRSSSLANRFWMLMLDCASRSN